MPITIIFHVVNVNIFYRHVLIHAYQNGSSPGSGADEMLAAANIDDFEPPTAVDLRYGSDSADTVDGDTATGGGEEQAVHHVTFLIEYASVVSSRSSPSPGVGPRPR